MTGNGDKSPKPGNPESVSPEMFGRYVEHTRDFIKAGRDAFHLQSPLPDGSTIQPAEVRALVDSSIDAAVPVVGQVVDAEPGVYFVEDDVFRVLGRRIGVGDEEYEMNQITLNLTSPCIETGQISSEGIPHLVVSIRTEKQRADMHKPIVSGAVLYSDGTVKSYADPSGASEAEAVPTDQEFWDRLWGDTSAADGVLIEAEAESYNLRHEIFGDEDDQSAEGNPEDKSSAEFQDAREALLGSIKSFMDKAAKAKDAGLIMQTKGDVINVEKGDIKLSGESGKDWKLMQLLGKADPWDSVAYYAQISHQTEMFGLQEPIDEDSHRNTQVLYRGNLAERIARGELFDDDAVAASFERTEVGQGLSEKIEVLRNGVVRYSKVNEYANQHGGKPYHTYVTDPVEVEKLMRNIVFYEREIFGEDITRR